MVNIDSQTLSSNASMLLDFLKFSHNNFLEHNFNQSIKIKKKKMLVKQA